MTSSHGKFVWHELMTTDTKAAETFYTRVTGWTATDPGMPGMSYTILNAGETGVGGIMEMPAGLQAPPHWIGYIYVDDVDKAASLIAAAGGAIHKAADDIPNVGRFAVVADPQGGTFIIFKPNPEPEVLPPPPAPGAPGIIGWNELVAGDALSVWPFYAAQFGWTETGDHDMGAMGTYKTFAANGTFGGMMTRPPFIPYPVWRYYINVEDIDAASARVTGNGGHILNGPMQVPGGSWVINAQDPQGAHFALVGPRAQ
jgi:predicted enzyme related to lactoylglutathione lyase